MREGEAHAFALADPVLLHRLDALGPARQAGLHALEQLVGVLRDLQVVARDLALLDQRAGAPAAALDDLLVGEHGLVQIQFCPTGSRMFRIRGIPSGRA